MGKLRRGVMGDQHDLLGFVLGTVMHALWSSNWGYWEILGEPRIFLAHGSCVLYAAFHVHTHEQRFRRSSQ